MTFFLPIPRMRYLRIFYLHFERVFEDRFRSFVWFLIPVSNNLLIILFWKGALGSTHSIAGWTLSSLTAYYFLLTIAGSMLNAHIEEDISQFDIKQGEMVRYLVRPFPYYWIKFFEEMPYRLLQGGYGIILIGLVVIFLHIPIPIRPHPLSAVIIILAIFISFTYKMNIGLLSFWFKEIRGFTELLEIVSIIFGGGVLPLVLLPAVLKNIAILLPFSYIGYFPVVAVQGVLAYPELLWVIGSQCVWLILLIAANRIVWSRGVKEFTGTGQ